MREMVGSVSTKKKASAWDWWEVAGRQRVERTHLNSKFYKLPNQEVLSNMSRIVSCDLSADNLWMSIGIFWGIAKYAHLEKAMNEDREQG